jgi:hypothetical protein
MRKTTTAIIGAAGLAALGLINGDARAQGAQVQSGQIIQIPPGAVVLVLPAGIPMQSMPMFQAAFPFPPMASPSAMFREMEQVMANAQRTFADPGWAGQNGTLEVTMPQAGGSFSSVVVTSVTDKSGTCTQRITYASNDAAPKVEIRSTNGAACAAMGMPAAAPDVNAPQRRAAPHTLMVDRRSRPAPLRVAQLNN